MVMIDLTRIVHRWTRSVALLLAVTAMIGLAAAAHGAMLYKDYVVRYDRGWDILCDPYEVQRGDWVLKIFRQKGEIAHEDFREFLGIFQRLNPHVKDIDRIRPGQIVDIPLKKLAQGTLPGQASGVVTIPFVMIANPREMVEKHSTSYTIRKGDTVSQLIANQFGGRYGNLTYQQGLKLFKAVNPHVKDVNRIYAGQQIYLPDPSIRQQNWYSALFDDAGDLVDAIDDTAGTGGGAAPPPPMPAAMAPPSPPARTENLGPAAEAASVMGGRLLNKGTYFLPMQQGSDFELDLSRFPMIDLANGSKIVLTTQDKVMNVDLPLIQSTWDDVKVVKVNANATSREILDAVFAAFADRQADNQLAFTDGGVSVQINAKWVRRETAVDGQLLRQTCITPIPSAAMRTHDAIVRYLDQNDITLNEVLDQAVANGPRTYPVHQPQEASAIDGSSQKELIASFSETMGYRYSANTAISFPYAGIQVEALSNLLAFGNGKEILVDFGDLYGDAVKAIRETGLEIIQIAVDEGPQSIIRKLLETAGTAYTANPVFYGADRPAEFNTAIIVNGILVPTGGGVYRLFTEQPIPELIGIFLRDKGVRLVRIATGAR